EPGAVTAVPHVLSRAIEFYVVCAACRLFIVAFVEPVAEWHECICLTFNYIIHNYYSIVYMFVDANGRRYSEADAASEFLQSSWPSKGSGSELSSASMTFLNGSSCPAA
ncbi:MAG TPA: hypothetical protein VIL70_04335, partial [Chthoniobacterales bacterium]